MGKKKSVVLMTLITIVLLVLCALVAFPSVPVPGSHGIKKWNPAVMQYDLGEEFSGGHYAYYYPQGVISEIEYNNDLEDKEGDDATEYAASYKRYEKDGVPTSLYMSTDEDDCIWEDKDGDKVVSEQFQTAFQKAAKMIEARFAARAQKTGSSFRVSIVDDYAIRVDLSASENSDNQTAAANAELAFTQYANVGALSFQTVSGETTETVDELKEDGVTVKDLIKRVSVKTQYKRAYVKIDFTSKGKSMIKDFKNSDATALNLTLGGETLLQISTDYITSKNEAEIIVGYDAEVLTAETLCVLINSAMENGGVNFNDNEELPFVMEAPTGSEIRTYPPVYGDTLVWVYVAVLAVVIAACVLAIVKMGGFGVMNLYTSVSYLAIAAFCFAFISKGVFVVSLGSVFVFLAGFALTNVLNAYIYNAIKEEAGLGKTISSSVKNGYKKTIWTVVDAYAVLLLGGIALLIGVASLHTIALQAIICIATGAFCNLLWGRVINVMLLSASKDKYKYFRLVREDDGDDE